jgi:hypothetical protein
MKHIKFLVILFIIFIGNQNHCFSQYYEGDTLKFWSVSYIDWPPLQGLAQRQVNAICKKVGNHCYIFVEDSAAQPSQTLIDSVVHMFDFHFYDSLTFRYGPVPNVFDNDPKIFILVLNEYNWAGYFDPGQQMSDSIVYAHWNKHSSQREIIYEATNWFSVGGILAHEFGHILHWQQHHFPESIVNTNTFWKEAWIDEGFATFGEIYLLENIYQHNVLDYEAFFASNPDQPLIYFSDYDQVKLFMLFMYEHFGKWKYISALISNPLCGIIRVDSALKQLGYPESFDDAFEQWVIANYVDDSVYNSGKYSYTHYRFPSCYISADYTSFPTVLVNSTVSPYGSDYVSFTSSVPKPIVIDFYGQLDSKFRIDFILKNTANNHIDSIIGVPLDRSNHTKFIADSLGSAYNKVIMVVMNVDSTIHENQTASYSYSAGNYSGIESEIKNKIIIFPNPVKDKLFLVSLNNLNGFIEINDIQGRVHFNQKYINTATIDVSGLAKGIYIVRIINNKETHIEKIIKE